MSSAARTILIVILALLLIGTLPDWGYSSGWHLGYYPAYGLGTVLVVVFVLILIDKL